MDSIYDPGYQRRFVQGQLSDRVRRFFDGLMERQVTVSDTLTIAGVAPDDREYRMSTAPIVIPERTSRRLSSAGLAISENPTDLLMAARTGTLDSR